MSISPVRQERVVFMQDVNKDRTALKEERESIRGKLEYYQELIRQNEKMKQEEKELEY